LLRLQSFAPYYASQPWRKWREWREWRDIGANTRGLPPDKRLFPPDVKMFPAIWRKWREKLARN
jgi:hypothetical protein